MNRMSEGFMVAAVAILFGLALGSLSPFPHADSEVLLAVSSVAYISAYMALRRFFRPFGVQMYGIATFACFLTGWLWYWFGVMGKGWWYPPVFPLVQSVYSVDGESGYDAAAANLGFLIWVIFTIAYFAYHLTKKAGR